MTLRRPEPQKAVCDQCGGTKESASGGAPKGWYLVTSDKDYRADFCCWDHLTRFFVGKKGLAPATAGHIQETE